LNLLQKITNVMMMSDVIFSQQVKKHVPLAFSNASPPLLRVSRKLRASFTRAIYSGAADMFNLAHVLASRRRVASS